MTVRSLAIVLVVLVGCRPVHSHNPTSGRVTITRLGDNSFVHRLFGPGHTGDEDDWLIEGSGLRVVIAAKASTARPETPGTVTRIGTPGPHIADDIRSIEPWVMVAGRAVPLEREVLSTLVVSGRPILQLTAWVDSNVSTALSVVREYSIDVRRNALRVVTRVTNLGTATSPEISFGSRVGWGGASPFAPGLGVVSRSAHGSAPWVGLTSHDTSVAWTRVRGDLDLVFTEDQHDTMHVATFTEVLSPRSVALSPGASITDDALLLVAHGDLAAVARTAADLRAEPFRDVSLVVTGAGGETPVVTVTELSHGREVLMVQPDQGAERIPLAPGRYAATVTAPGHSPGDPVAFTVDPVRPTLPVHLQVPPGGVIRVTAVNAVTQENIPVRVVIRGIPPTPDPVLGPNDRASGAGVVAIAPDGHIEIPVPNGHYTVTVSHGPEWNLAQTEVTVTHTLRADFSAGLTHVLPMEAWTACDLHVHARPSFDSRVSLADRVASLVAEGIGLAIPSEHNVVGDYRVGVAALPADIHSTFRWLPGVEVTTDRSAQPWGHFNVFPYRPHGSFPAGGPPPFLNTTPREIFHAARENNPDVVIQVNHPRMQPNIGYFNVTGLDTRTNRAVSPEYDPDYDAIEVFNGFYIGHIEYVEAGLTDWFHLLNTGARYVATGSSDSHQIAYQWAGYPRTYVHVPTPAGVSTQGITPESNPDALTILRGLRAGHAFVTSGPMLFLSVGNDGPGDVHPLATTTSVPVRVRVQAPPWLSVDSVDLVVNGQRVRTLPIAPSELLTRLDTVVTLTLDPGSWLVAIARGPRDNLEIVLPDSHGQPFAFTNPIYFDQGG